ncbi:MAG: sodium:calcium antiporter [Candidatus Aenigmarchaeota archaeon]|nr:sodium:calcium antiporter [Candidatus Aenigmarchaeota archaeon]
MSLIIVSIFTIIVTSLAIWISGDKFVQSAQKIGNALRISKSVRGATLDAVASSFPELTVSTIGLVLFHNFDVGIGTIVGSGLFNIIVIPAVSAFVAPIAFKVSKEVVYRDGLFYALTIIVFLASLFYLNEWGYLVGLGFIAFYLLYLFEIQRQTREFRKKHKLQRKTKTKIDKDILILLVSIIVITVAGYYLVKYVIILSKIMNVSSLVLSFIIIAVATSLSDTAVSVADARRGDVSGATSNAIGSNIFDILICLGLPILIAGLMGIKVVIENTYKSFVFGLLALSVVTIYLLAERMELTKPRAVILFLSYVGYIVYVVFFM